MATYKRVDTGNEDRQNERSEPKEIVGSTNLREVLIEQGYIAGSFSINGHRFTNFEARSPGQVVRTINEANTGVVASLDDGYHLVLESDGGSDIKIGDGAAYDKAQERDMAQVRDRYQARGEEPPAEAGERERGEKDKTVLEALGLEADDDEAFGWGEPDDWKAGPTADERKEAREKRLEERASNKGIIRSRSAHGGATEGEDHIRAKNQGQMGGGTTQANRGPSDTVSDDPHNPVNTGNAVPGTGGRPRQGSDMVGLSPPQNVKPASRKNPGVEGLPDAKTPS